MSMLYPTTAYVYPCPPGKLKPAQDLRLADGERVMRLSEGGAGVDIYEVEVSGKSCAAHDRFWGRQLTLMGGQEQPTYARSQGAEPAQVLRLGSYLGSELCPQRPRAFGEAVSWEIDLDVCVAQLTLMEAERAEAGGLRSGRGGHPPASYVAGRGGSRGPRPLLRQRRQGGARRGVVQCI